MKLNNKGFLLVETLIATLFIMAVFTVMYTNVLPLLGDYERRIKYDDIDGKYSAHLIRKIIKEDENKNTLFSFNNYKEIKCSEFKSGSYCTALLEELGVTNIYMTNYSTSFIKNNYKENDKYLKKYIDDLPNYNKNTTAKYRLIVKLTEDRFSNIEVVK